MDNKHTARSTASVGGSAGQPAVAAMDTSTATPRRAPTVAAALALTVSAAPTGAPAAARKMTNPLRNQPERLQKVREREAEDGQLEAQTLLLSAVSQQQTWSCKVCTFQNPMGNTWCTMCEQTWTCPTTGFLYMREITQCDCCPKSPQKQPALLQQVVAPIAPLPSVDQHQEQHEATPPLHQMWNLVGRTNEELHQQLDILYEKQKDIRDLWHLNKVSMFRHSTRPNKSLLDYQQQALEQVDLYLPPVLQDIVGDYFQAWNDRDHY